MLLTVKELVSILRNDLSIVNSEAGVEDTGLLDMTDEQIILLITLGATRLSTDADSLDELLEDPHSAYPLILLAKIELFMTLATLKADLVDMNADNNNRLSLSQRFSHYKELADATQEAFDKWNEDNDGSSGGTGGVVTTYDTILSKRFMSIRNYELQAKPIVKLRIANITENSADVSWIYSNFDHFGTCRLYLGVSEVIDPYLDGGSANNKVTDNAILLKSSMDIRDNAARIKGLVSGTTYYVAVVEVERNGVYGYVQKTFTTLDSEVDGDDTAENGVGNADGNNDSTDSLDVDGN